MPGGGACHEQAHAGYFCPRMSTAVVSGDVFPSPTYERHYSSGRMDELVTDLMMLNEITT